MAKEYTQIGLTPNRSNLNDEEPQFPLRLKWKVQTLAPFVGVPLISGARVYCDATSYSKGGKNDSKLFAYNALSGKKEWEYMFEAEIGGGGAGHYCIYNEMVITVDNTAMVVIKDGKQILRDEALGGGYPVFYKGLLIFSYAGGVRFVDPSNWTLVRKLDAEKTMDVSCYEDKVVFGSLEGNSCVNLNCYSFETGHRIWVKSVKNIGEYIFGRTAPKTVQGAIIGRFPLVINGKIFLGLNRYVCCFDLETGDLRWKTDLWAIREGAHIRETVYKEGRLYGFDTREFYCFDAETGEIIYKTGGTKKAGAGFGEIPFVSGNVFFTASVGIYAFDLVTGNLLWEFYSKRYYPFVTQPVFINGRLYAGCSDGYLYCFESAKD